MIEAARIHSPPSLDPDVTSNQVIEGAYEKILGSQYDHITVNKSVVNYSGQFGDTYSPPNDNDHLFQMDTFDEHLSRRRSTAPLRDDDSECSVRRPRSPSRNREKIWRQLREGKLRLRLLQDSTEQLSSNSVKVYGKAPRPPVHLYLPKFI